MTKTQFTWLFLATLISTPVAAQTPTNGPLRVSQRSSLYFEDAAGKPVYLAGSHGWNNLQDWGTRPNPSRTSPLDYNAHLDFLAGKGHNFTRGWLWEHPRWIPWSPNGAASSLFIQDHAYARVGPGNAQDGRPRFDLNRWNQPFFDRLRRRIAAAGRRGIYVSVMLFQGWSLKKPFAQGDPWQSHPYHRANNVNGINGDVNGDGNGDEIHTLARAAVTRLQKLYVRKMIDTLNSLDNVIWEVINESHPGSTRWQAEMVRAIRQHQRGKPNRHLVWQTPWNPYAGTTDKDSNAAVEGSAADVLSYTEDKAAGYPFSIDPPARRKGARPVLLDTDHLQPGRPRWDFHRWVWRAFARGYHPIFMDTQWGLPLWPRAIPPQGADRARMQDALGHTVQASAELELDRLTPQAGGSTPASTGYCLFQTGRQYAVVQPNGSSGRTEIRLQLPAGRYHFQFVRLDDGARPGGRDRGSFDWSGGRRRFTPSFAGASALIVLSGRRPKGGGAKASQLVADAFDTHTAGKRLNGLRTPVGNAKWFASGALVTATGSVGPRGGAARATVWGEIEVPAARNRTLLRVSARYALKVDAAFALGFQLRAKASLPVNPKRARHLFVRVTRAGAWSLIAGRNILAQGTLPSGGAATRVRLTVRLKPNTVTLKLGGQAVARRVALGSFRPGLSRAVWQLDAAPGSGLRKRGAEVDGFSLEGEAGSAPPPPPSGGVLSAADEAALAYLRDKGTKVELRFEAAGIYAAHRFRQPFPTLGPFRTMDEAVRAFLRDIGSGDTPRGTLSAAEQEAGAWMRDNGRKVSLRFERRTGRLEVHTAHRHRTPFPHLGPFSSIPAAVTAFRRDTGQ